MPLAKLAVRVLATACAASLLLACNDYDPVRYWSRVIRGRQATGASSRSVAAHSVLFIGNSLTYYNDLPAVVHALDPSIAVDSVTAGGASLGDHWNAGTAAGRIVHGHYTHVVLQERTYEPLTNTPGFHEFAGRFASTALGAGAKPVIFEAWAHRDHSDAMYQSPWSGGSPDAMQQLLLAQVRSVATETHSVIALPGEAFRQSRLIHPEIELYAPDGNHPSPAGTYLAACVLVQTLTGAPPATAATTPLALPPDITSALRRAAERATEQQN